MSGAVADELVDLYERFGEDLARVRDEQRLLYEGVGYSPWQSFFAYRWVRTSARKAGFDWERKRFMNPQLDDIESEITYLRIRDRRPESVVEISPFRGWSTTWILRALRDNGAGRLVSFDLHDDAHRFVPKDLAERWRLVVGDVRERVGELPETIDYLFIDADHRRAFAEWYLETLIPRLSPGAGISIHDVFHGRGPQRGRGEARVVLDWLDQWRIAWFTASRFGPGKVYDRVQAERLRLGFAEEIHYGDHDSMIFFTLSRMPGVKNWRPVNDS